MVSFYSLKTVMKNRAEEEKGEKKRTSGWETYAATGLA